MVGAVKWAGEIFAAFFAGIRGHGTRLASRLCAGGDFVAARRGFAETICWFVPPGVVIITPKPRDESSNPAG